MKHLSEEQIVLHYYGDSESEGEARLHLEACSECRGEFERVKRVLESIQPIEVPEPPPVFEEKTWLKLRDRLPVKRGGIRRWFAAPPKWAMAGAMALLLVVAFLAGHYSRHVETPKDVGNPQRVVLLAVGGHLERSQMLLVEIMNADDKAPLDLSGEQQQARELLDWNHLYRLSAEREGDPQIARLLDDLGRVLAEIANSPSELSPSDLEQIQHRIQSDNLLFKVRVVGSEVNSRVRRQDQKPSAGVSQRL
ncbi:MAG TPA: hypothetical protein VKE93_02145 [Candidatus Angelobacter sp.]|nr:hypothetical protein [Candidatus Angelobacter sp.]